MPKLRDYFMADLDVFINPDEFGETHTVDGQTLLVVVDSEHLKRLAKIPGEAYTGKFVLQIKKIDFGEAPALGQIINFDGELYRISDFQEEAGLYSITLEANLS